MPDDPYGTRTRVTAVKGRCPRPLDEGAAVGLQMLTESPRLFGFYLNDARQVKGMMTLICWYHVVALTVVAYRRSLLSI